MYDNKDYRMSGRLTLNNEKRNDKSPDYMGFYTDEEGRRFWVSGWKVKDAKGRTAISFSMKSQQEEGSRQYRGGGAPRREPLYETAKKMAEAKAAPASPAVPLPDPAASPFDDMPL